MMTMNPAIPSRDASTPPASAVAVRSAAAWRPAIAFTLAALAAVVWSLASMTIVRGTAEAGAGNLRALWPYWIASAATWLGLTALWRMLLRGRGKDQRGFGRAAALIFLVAIAARVAVLIAHEPGLSDDVYRYIFDGRNLASGANPYLVLPGKALESPDERWPGEHDLARLVTYPDLATPYLPVSQCVFGALGKAIGPSWSDPASSARVFRVGFTAIEMAMLPIIFLALRRTGRSAWWAALYAWHPLPLSEIAGSGHQDIIGIILLVAALALHSRSPAAAAKWSGLLALSALGKPFTIPAGAMMLRTRPALDWLKSALAGAAAILVMIMPFWIIAGSDGDRRFAAFLNWKRTIDELAEKFAHFGGVYQAMLAIVRWLMPAEGQPAGFNLRQEWLARQLCLGIFVIAAATMFFSRRRDAWQATCGTLFALVMLTTTAHPWYLLWAFALVPMANRWPIWILSLTLPWGYAVLGDVAHWTVPAWIAVAAYAPVIAAIAASVVLHFLRRGDSGPTLRET